MAAAPTSADLTPTPETAFLAGRPRRIRGGPIAAVIATAAVLSATAVPGMAPAPERLEVPRSLSVEPVGPALHDSVALDLGAPYGSFRMGSASTLARRSDGSWRISIQAERMGEGDPAGFEGSLDVRAPLAADLAASEGLRALVPAAEGDTDPGVADVEAPPAGARCYRAAGGRLQGTGALDGVELTLRTAPGTVGWSGPLGDADRALAAPLVWFVDATPEGVPEADMGGGWIAVTGE